MKDHLESGGETFEKLCDALADAFRTRDKISGLVAFKLDGDLSSIEAPVDTLPEVIRKVVKWAAAQDRLAELVADAKEMQPANRALKEISDDDVRALSQHLSKPAREVPAGAASKPSFLSATDPRWLVGGAVAVLAIVVLVVALNSGGTTDAATPTTAAAPTTSVVADAEQTAPVAPASSADTTAAATTAAATTPADTTAADTTPSLEVTSVRASNGDLAAEQSAIGVLVRNPGDVSVNLDRATFTVNRVTSLDCNFLPTTGGPDLQLFARGFEVPPYSVPIFEFEHGVSESVSLNPPRRIPADQEEVLLSFDLDYTLGESQFVTLPAGLAPPYYDEEFSSDGTPYREMSIFEVNVAVRATTGQAFDGQTVVVAHPRLVEGFFTAEGLEATCGFSSDIAEEGAAQHRGELAAYCDADVVSDQLGGNEQFDRLMRNLSVCG